jgi:predicted GNAT superfamily acetyltransferase
MTTSPVTLETLQRLPVREQAAAAAEAAAAGAGLTIIPLDDVDRIMRASTLFSEVWAVSPEHPLIPPNTLRALEHAGNYAFGALEGDRMIGAIVGFLGRIGGSLQLHSHILGVLPGSEGRRIGFALKQHQRAWALDQGLHVVTWTFDPLVRRNAYFNLAKLGAVARAYYPNFYGAMDDGINDGDESDRVLVEWTLAEPGVIAASVGHPVEPDLPTEADDDIVVVLDEDADGRPTVTERRARVLLASIPEDIVRVRATDRALADRWRAVLRDVFVGALEDGYSIAGMTRSGSYVFHPPGR